ncbi:MAG: FtsX-like permease family protein, partial [Coriobacteriaceae bacterium]|nr:FtsX-like permease family protein [Coriobacteriaceae bacterium]
MLARLAVRNVRRSARDYAVYFVTLLFGVAVFYAFNSIDSQAVLFDIEKNAVGSILEMTNYFIGLFSVAVAVVLAFLVTYANRFIIKRRKREFGTYLLLGMSASRVACVLSIEMLVVGAVSLVVGLVVGLVLSQALAFATAALMGTTMTHYTFVVSTSALVKTLICFAILFAAALVMNVVFVSRRKVGDLLAEHAEAKVTSRIPLWARIVGFVLALAVLAVAYWLLWDNQFKEFDNEFGAATLLMVIGTFLLFWSGSTIVLSLVKRAHGFYFRGLHAFTARQLSSKVGTAFASLSVVCIMLFFALTTVSVGFGVRALFVDSIEQTTRY